MSIFTQEELDRFERARELGEQDARSNLAPEPDRHELRGLERTEYNIGFHQEVRFQTQCEIAKAYQAQHPEVVDIVRKSIVRPAGVGAEHRFQIQVLNQFGHLVTGTTCQDYDIAKDKAVELLEKHAEVGDQVVIEDRGHTCMVFDK